MPIRTSLVLPCFNEEENLISLQAELLALPDIIQGEVILVDNGSSDNTGNVIAGLHNENPRIVHVKIENNIGYGFGIVSGLNSAKGDFVGWSHADGQMNLKDAVTASSMVWTKKNPSAFFVMGRRRGRSLYDKLFELGMSAFETVVFGTALNDITAQPKMMCRSVFESWPEPPDDFSLDLFAYVYAKKHNLSVLKFDTEYHQRTHGTSTWNTGFASRLNLIKRTIGYSFKLRRKINNDRTSRDET